MDAQGFHPEQDQTSGNIERLGAQIYSSLKTSQNCRLPDSLRGGLVRGPGWSIIAPKAQCSAPVTPVALQRGFCMLDGPPGSIRRLVESGLKG